MSLAPGERTRELTKGLEKARYAALNSRPISDSAKAFIETLAALVTSHELDSGARKNARRKKAGHLISAIERFAGDLLFAAGAPESAGWVYRSLAADSFQDTSVSYRTFKRLTEALVALRLIERKKGFRSVMQFEATDPWLSHFARATRFRATDKLLAHAESRGITRENTASHFITALPERPLILKATSKRTPLGAKVQGKRRKFNRTERANKLEDEIKELNQFLDAFDIRGGIHRGYVRIFNLGDDPSFDWNKGGRLYSCGEDSYQRMSKEDRLRMTINGEAVVELDVRASYLTIFYSLCGRSAELPEDPYDLPDVPRSVVKKWIVATFGSNGSFKRWPSELIKDHKEETGKNLKAFPVSAVRAKVSRHLPLMEQWGQTNTNWADLMYLESQAMVATMIELMEKGVPSLSVHDSLIVPRTSTELAKTVLAKRFHIACRAIPALRVTFKV
jgi:hypothetical protein